MNKQLEAKLREDFPHFFMRKTDCEAFPFDAFGFEAGDGWFLLIYKDFRDLTNLNPEIKVHQVKEKFGTLRIYTSGGEAEIAIWKNTAQASSQICEHCGKPGSLREHKGWWTTLCDMHFELSKGKKGLEPLEQNAVERMIALANKESNA